MLQLTKQDIFNFIRENLTLVIRDTWEDDRRYFDVSINLKDPSTGNVETISSDSFYVDDD